MIALTIGRNLLSRSGRGQVENGRGSRYRRILPGGGKRPATSRSCQSVADSKRGCGCPVLAGRLIEDVREVIGHCFLTESQGMRDLAIALALGNQLEHRHLTLGQMRWKLCVWLRSWTRGKRA